MPPPPSNYCTNHQAVISLLLAAVLFQLPQSKSGTVCYRARQLYKNVSMLFLFPVKDGKLSTGVNATFDASCYG